MASSSAQDDADGGLFAGINVTPLVDITLVLLIVMMVAAPIMMSTPSIKVSLPKAATGEETKKSMLALTLARDAGQAQGYRLYVNGKVTDEAQARTVVKELAGKDPELQAIVAADKGVPYGDVMHVVDLVRALGVSKFALNTEASP